MEMEFSAMPKVLVLYYSTYGHIEAMAQAVAEGGRSAGVAVDIKRAAETAPEEVAKAGHFKLDQAAPVARIDDLVEYDAISYGLPPVISSNLIWPWKLYGSPTMTIPKGRKLVIGENSVVRPTAFPCQRAPAPSQVAMVHVSGTRTNWWPLVIRASFSEIAYACGFRLSRLCAFRTEIRQAVWLFAARIRRTWHR